MFNILLTGIRKIARRIAASYMRSTWHETNPNLRSLWIYEYETNGQSRICYVSRDIY